MREQLGLGLAVAVLGVLLIASGASAGQVVMSTDVPKYIADDDWAGLTSILVFPSSMVITDIDLILFVQHTSVPDLHIELTSPGGTTAVLLTAFTENGILTNLGTPDDFYDTHFDDDAPINLRDGVPPYTGHYNVIWPGVDLLSVFDGEDAGGTWTLFVSDRAGADVGYLNGWGVDVVPEPATLTLLGLGLAGLVRARKGRR